MAHQSHHIPQTLHHSAVARLLHEVCTDLTRAAEQHLPELAPKFANDIVVVADSTQLTGELGSYTVNGCRIDGKVYDKLSVSLRHPAHTDVNPAVYATKVLTTLTHELAHACTVRHGEAGSADPGHDGHTEEFGVAAEHLGLEVTRCEHYPGRVFTPRLTSDAHQKYQAQIRRLSRVNFAGVNGVGLAGPHGMRGSLHPNLQTKSYFSLATGI